MELLQLKYFCDAAVSENFSATARRYFVPPSCISQSVGRLERELGCPLFDHKGNRIVLNGAGKQFYRKAAEALALLEEGRAALAQSDGRIGGELDIVCSCSRITVTAAMERFMESYPEVSLLLRHELPKTADCDVLIADRCPFAYSRRELLLDEPLALAVKSTHPLAAREQISVEALAGERLITMAEGSSLHDITLRACTAAGFMPNIAVRLEDPSFIRKYVEMGLGVALVPSVAWRGLFSEGVVLCPVADLHRKVYAYLPADRQEKPATARFLEILGRVHREIA